MTKRQKLVIFQGSVLKFPQRRTCSSNSLFDKLMRDLSVFLGHLLNV